MPKHEWVKECPIAISVCDADGAFLEMNDRAQAIFASQGGQALLGRSIFPCHQGEHLDKLKSLLRAPATNAYISQKAGVRRLIYQAPWRSDGVFRGLVELIVELPADLPERKA